MPDQEPPRGRTSCPHCGKPAGLRWSALLPSNARNRAYLCVSCGGKFDVSDTSKMASIFGGLLGFGPGVLLFGRLARAGSSSTAIALGGTAAVLVCFGLGSMGLAWLTLRLVAKR